MCFAPQRRALFRHLNFQNSSDTEVFCTFWLGNVLRATTACTFSTSQLPKLVRHWGVLYILTWKCASRHNGVHFFMSHLASWLRTRRFSEPTFRPSGATNHWKNTVFRDFPTFSRICIFFLLILSLLTLLTSAFQLSILSEVSLLNFLRLYLHPSFTMYIWTWDCKKLTPRAASGLALAGTLQEDLHKSHARADDLALNLMVGHPARTRNRKVLILKELPPRLLWQFQRSSQQRMLLSLRSEDLLHDRTLQS